MASFTCACIVGFNGTLCDNNQDECISHPCQNMGICHDLVNMFMCDCTPKPGYVGMEGDGMVMMDVVVDIRGRCVK